MLLIKNGLVYTMGEAGIIESDILVNDEGKIEKINKNIQCDCEVIDATGCNVYPGIIEAHCHLGLEEAGIGFEGSDTNEMNDPITPQVKVVDGINMMDETIRIANEHGIVTVCATPGSANVIGGEASIYKTTGCSVDQAIIKQDAAMKCAFGENPKRVYRDSKIKTRMGTAALFREAMTKARRYMEMKEAANGDVTKMPAVDMKSEALIPVLKKQMPLKAHAHRVDDILTSIRLANEFDLNMTLDHCTEGHLIPELVKASGFDAIVGPSLTHKSKFELKNKTFDTPSVLHNANVKVAITTDSPVVPQEFLPICAGLAIRDNFDAYEALKSITINAAEIIEIDNRVGSIEVGKDADIVVCKGDILNLDGKVQYTIVDGIITYKR